MSGLAAFVAGMGGGYLKGREQAREQERQDKLDAMREKQFGWQEEQANEQRRERENKLALENAITQTAQAGKVENDRAAVNYTNDAGEQKTAYQPDQQTADFAAQQQRLEESSLPTAPSVASNPTTTPASSVRTLDGGRKLFTGLTAAQQAKQYSDENPVGSYAKYMALSERLSGMAGGQELADKYLERAKKAEKEGAFQALNLLESGDTNGALKAWNSTGAARLQPGQEFKTVADKAGNKIHQVVNSDGSVAVANVESALLNYIGGIEGVTSRAASREKLGNDIKLKTWEYQNDPTKRYRDEKPGAVTRDLVTGKVVGQNMAGFVQQFEDDGTPKIDANGDYVYKPTPRGAGSGSGDVKIPEAIKLGLDDNKPAIPAAMDAYKTLVENYGSGPQPLADSKMQGIATRYARNPRTETTFNPKTGEFSEFFHDKREADKDGNPIGDATGGRYLIRSREYKDGGPIQKQQAADAYAKWTASMSASEREFYSGIAKSSQSADAYIKGAVEKAKNLKSEAETAIAKADTPQEKARITALWREKSAELEAEGRKVDFFRQFYKAPAQNAPGSAPAPAPAKQAANTTASYDEWMKAKNEEQQLRKNASRMSPEFAESYLANRLPDVQRRIKLNENYRTY